MISSTTYSQSKPLFDRHFSSAENLNELLCICRQLTFDNLHGILTFDFFNFPRLAVFTGTSECYNKFVIFLILHYLI